MRLLLLIAIAVPLAAQSPARQTDADAYTRYELLAPSTGSFRIIYEVSATTPGATHYFNPIRTGSVASDESAVDRASGRALPFEEVGAAVARAGGVRVTDSTQRFIRVTLARRVPPNGGEGRVLILKTYRDTLSYYTRGDTIVFARPLGIKRNAVVLPAGYELVSSSFPAQVLQEPDGRVGISFWNTTPSEAAVTVRAVPSRALRPVTSAVAARLGERARQSREIVYELRQPETHAFDLYHDYTESRAGETRYVNVVRAGSTVSDPSARNLDTGEPLRLTTPSADSVVFHFAPVNAGESVRLRIRETYTDAARYRLEGDELVWDRAFGRPANAVILPAGWMLVNSAMPAVVSTLPDGRVRLDFVNPRPDEMAVLVTARRR